MPGGTRVVVVMPAYNAARTLATTWEAIPPEVVDEVLLVDDRSADETLAEVAKLPILPDLVGPLIAGEADLVLGGADADPRRSESRWHAAVPIRQQQGAHHLREQGPASIVLRSPHGYRACSRRFLEQVPFMRNSNDLVFDTYVISQAVAFQMRVVEGSDPHEIRRRSVVDLHGGEHPQRPRHARHHAAVLAAPTRVAPKPTVLAVVTRHRRRGGRSGHPRAPVRRDLRARPGCPVPIPC